MKKYHLTFLLFLLSGFLFAQSQTLNSFDVADPDTNYWQYFDNHGGQHYQTSETADSALGWMNITYPTDNVAEGSGAMLIDYSAQNIEDWGGYTKLEHWNPDSNGTYDWSAYDTLSFWYNNITPQSEAGRVHLRVNLHDVSDAPAKTYDVTQVEYYYSFEYILDDEPGWHRWDIPLVNNANWDGLGFNLTGWSGITGNSVLDKDKIKGFSFEFSINNSGERGDYVTGAILIDNLHLRGLSEQPLLIFNGKTVNTSFTQFTWGQSSLEIVEGGGIDPNTNALLWTQGDEWANGWSGAGWNIDPAVDLSLRWPLDSLRFALKAESGTNSPLRVQFESSSTGVWGTTFEITADDQWHEYAFALADFYLTDDTKPGFDSTDITVVQFMGEGNATAGKKIWFDYIWTGSPVIDVVAPEAVALVTVAPDAYSNLVTWTDVPGEENEVYDVYCSASPITDINADGVDVVELNVSEGLGLSTHLLRAPVVDQDVTFYYAVVCKDAAGNESPIKVADGSVTNTAKGVTVIHPSAPAGFTLDGQITEWGDITPFVMDPDDDSTPGSIVTNTEIDNAADVSAKAYVAMDEENMYIAIDVEDDIITSDTTKDTYLRDAPDMFIGLYDWRGPTHTSLRRGEEPDYQLRFNKEALNVESLGQLGIPGDETYAWREKFPSGYIVEAKIPFTALANLSDPADAIFTPIVGKRIKIDFSINDADATGEREGILTYSPLNEDRSYAEVNRWSYTWIGDQFVDVDEESTVPLKYDLSQNYPNPFNPSTIIKYSVLQKGKVSLRVFNLLGQEVATLVNKVHGPGSYEVNFDASELATGMYIYQIQAGSFVTSKKMLLIK